MKKKKIIGIITFILIIIIAFFICKNTTIEKNKNKEYEDYTPQEEISEEQARQTKIILFFENIETGKLEAETRLIDANLLIKEPEKEILKLLIDGPKGSGLKKLIPEGTVVHDVKIENSCAIISVSNEFLQFENEENKLKIINSIVNTLTNLKEIKSVKFLINGEINDKFPDIYVKNNEIN